MSLENVVSNIAPTIVGFLDTLPKFANRMNAVYEEGLDYVEALKKFRLDNAKSPELTTYPLFIFRRSSLRHAEDGIGRRMVNHKVLQSKSDTLFETFKGIYGEIDIEFMVATPSMADLENFEISYLSEAGQATEKKFSYQLPSLGSFEYFVQYDVLGEKQIQIDQNHWKGVTGTATIRGFFFVATGEASKITQIQANFKSLLTSENFKTIIITP